MNKSEFVERVAEKAGLSRAAAARVVDAIFDAASGAISEVVHAAGSLNIPGFGTFTKRKRVATRKRHPASGVVIEVPERSTVVFRPGQGLRGPAVKVLARRGVQARSKIASLPARRSARGALVQRRVDPLDRRVAEIRRLAEHVWENRADAEQFLTSPHAMLDGKTPEQAAASPAGAERVRDILMRLEFGIPA
ncbi:MAG TPA: HU family DNA-binding protein [Longimicrobium sp.]|nr:HU family DNA-binding protein [Longimicrobium sp.]